jgi:hypothetical protein
MRNITSPLDGIVSPFGARRSGGNPYAAFQWAYDGSAAANYTLTSSRVSEAKNLGGAGSALNVASQATAAERPVIGTMADAGDAFAFTVATTEWLRADSLGTKMNVAASKRLVEVVFQPTALAADQTICSWKKDGTAHQFVHISIRATTGRVRVQRRGALVGDNRTLDSSIGAVAGAVNVLSLLFDAGTVTGYLNGDLLFSAADWVGAVTADLTCDKFALGAFLDTTLAAPTLPFNGTIRSFAFREY